MGDAVAAERAALVALLERPGACWPDVVAHVTDRGSAILVLADQLGTIDSLFPVADIDELIADADARIGGWTASGLDFRTLLDDDFPAQLRDIRELPPFLFGLGGYAPDDRAVAVVGTRQPSEHGLAMADRVAAALAERDVTVVSGLAEGVATAAHRAALRAGGRTVAIVGNGIRWSHPPENALLQAEIATDGLVLSQFWPDTLPTKPNFPLRDAVLSGYAAATVVVETDGRDSAHGQAELALRHGRPVILPRELLDRRWAREFAEKPGVHVVTDLAELLTVVEELVPASSDLADR